MAIKKSTKTIVKTASKIPAKPVNREKAPKTAIVSSLPKPDLAASTAQAEAQAWASLHPKPPVPPLGVSAEALGVSAESAQRMTALPKTKEDSNSAPLPEGYPYRTRMQRKEYEAEKHKLQIELLKAQSWVKETGQRIVLLF